MSAPLDIPYRTETLDPFILLLPRIENEPACSSLWRRLGVPKQSSLPKDFALTVLNPLAEREQTISIRCASEGILGIDLETTNDFRSEYHSGHPCNTVRPPCLGKAPPLPKTPIVSPLTTSVWEKITTFFYKKQPLSNHPPEATVPLDEDTEIPALAALRSSLPISQDQQVYRVAGHKHFRRYLSGIEVIFGASFTFVRCGRGQTMLSFRCQEGDPDGLIVNID